MDSIVYEALALSFFIVVIFVVLSEIAYDLVGEKVL